MAAKVVRQASRRSWRIGQTRPVKVVFMSYRNTLQADALKLVAKKMQSSLAVEGELPEDGLAAYGDDGDDMMMALARKIVSGDEEDEAETMEDYFGHLTAAIKECADDALDERIFGLFSRVDEDDLQRVEQDPVPNRHAAMHGFVSYSSPQNSLNTIFVADYMFRLIGSFRNAQTERE